MGASKNSISTTIGCKRRHASLPSQNRPQSSYDYGVAITTLAAILSLLLTRRFSTIITFSANCFVSSNKASGYKIKRAKTNIMGAVYFYHGDKCYAENMVLLTSLFGDTHGL
ncbi:hypothetical protein MNBD_NITROSPINAE04-2674 [hydrothermal vent metagenome]|uniref:Uncharacterized protein n=1 Tax=hydrothermal vent metagenome TaxID=652676 RepID=A0A3B1C5L1_9ZZZZ